MDGFYWLVSLLIIVTAIGAYVRSWYYRPSGMPEILTASYSYQTLEYMDFYARHENENSVEYKIYMYHITSYMKSRQLRWRQRNDIIRYMVRMGWVYEIKQEIARSYAINRAGKHELETADGLGRAVNEAAQALYDEGISGDQAKATAAAVVAAALRVHAHSASSENRRREEASANEIEEAARTRDSERIDRTITRTKDILQIITSIAPAIREILRVFGWL